MDYDMMLRTWPGYFRAIWRGEKRAELRRNDRNFQVGDRVLLIEFDPGLGHQPYPHRDILVKITHVLEGTGKPGIQDDYCVWSFSVLRRRINNKKPHDAAIKQHGRGK